MVIKFRNFWTAHQNLRNHKLICENRIDVNVWAWSRPFRPFFPAFFDLLTSLGQLGLVILLLKCGPNFGPCRVIPY